jgi:hypothetical protein
MAIREHTLKVANRTTAAVSGHPHIMIERRQRPSVPAEWIPKEFHPWDDQAVN